MQILFSINEIQELKDCKELFEDMKVDDIEVICFEIIDDLIHGNDIYQREDIVYASEQFELAVGLLKEIAWFDSTKLENLLPKVKQLLVSTNSS
ncbi:hypothetical protein QE450_003944 [Paenibacillus sp. SORGH_AS306]|uniref:hypothetical protein n=1 Tax=unclassified Paenibacillus TaxID=185978 RepID=UPI00277E850D|nr:MULTISPECIES: hypothetical protein [unclassified Paenibacillus]MDQ1236446.1 hypothetical protein [Paenibacillus sp. SORGH_AS_0306]MDR6108799.1 hypothetical protein [Paenibacillus sp. SORGH_AS_0338]